MFTQTIVEVLILIAVVDVVAHGLSGYLRQRRTQDKENVKVCNAD